MTRDHTRGHALRAMLSVIAVVALIATACGGSTPAASSAPAPAAAASAAPSAAPATASATYTIGYIADLTGTATSTSLPREKAVRLAVDTINKDKYLGASITLKLVEQDGATDPATSINVANQMISNPDILAVMCCSLSGVAGPLKPVFVNGKTPLVITTAVLAGLPQPPYVYRTAILQGVPGGANEQLAKKAITQFKPKSVVILVTQDSDAMKGEATAWQTPFTAAGGITVKTVGTGSKDSDFSGPATEALAAKPDLIVDSMLGEPAALMIKTLRDRGYTGQIIANSAMGAPNFYKVAGKALDGLIYAVAYSSIVKTPANEKFSKDYEAQFKEIPDLDASQGFIATYYVADGLKKAIAATSGKPTRDAVGKALESMTSIDTIAGKFTFTGGQAQSADVAYIQYQPNGNGVQSVWKP